MCCLLGRGLRLDRTSRSLALASGGHLVLPSDFARVLLWPRPERLALDAAAGGARAGATAACSCSSARPGSARRRCSTGLAAAPTACSVLRARGIESEARVPFAGLLELLRPALGALDRIPAPQADGAGRARWRCGPAAPGPLRRRRRDAQPARGQRRGPAAAGARRRRPLARRVERRGAAVRRPAAAGRPGRGPAGGARRRALAARRRRLPTLRLAGLDREDAAALLARARRRRRRRVERLLHATAGNPLALIELAADAERLAAAPVDVPVPVVDEHRARRSCTAPSACPSATRRSLVLAAAQRRRRRRPARARAAARSGSTSPTSGRPRPPGWSTLDRRPVEFRHPLARAAVYADASAAAPSRGAPRRSPTRCPTGRRPAGLAPRRGDVGPDDAASAALDQAAERARERSAYAVAAAAFERAARPRRRPAAPRGRSARRPTRPGSAGDARRGADAARGGRARGRRRAAAGRVDRLRGADRAPAGPVTTARAARRGGRADRRGRPRAGDRDARRGLLGVLRRRPGRRWPRPRGAAELAGPERIGRAQFFARDGRRHGAGPRRPRRGAAPPPSARLSRSSSVRRPARRAPARPWAVLGPLCLREAEASRELSSAAAPPPRAVRRRHPAAAAAVRSPATRRRPTAGRRPRPATTRASGSRARPGSGSTWRSALAGLAWLEARQGREAPCRAACGRGDGAVRRARLRHCRHLGAAGARRARARPRAARRGDRAHLTRGSDAARAGYRRRRPSPAPELVEAYVRLGRRDEAAALAGRVPRPGRGQGPAVGARPRRALPRPAGGADELDACFDEALELHDRTRTCSRPPARSCSTARACGGPASAARPRAAARGARDVRAARRAAVGRAGARRARGDRRDRAPARRQHARPAHAAGAADRPPARRGPDDARGRRGAVPQPEDDRVPPAPRLRQARHPLPRGAGRGVRAIDGARRRHRLKKSSAVCATSCQPLSIVIA